MGSGPVGFNSHPITSSTMHYLPLTALTITTLGSLIVVVVKVAFAVLMCYGELDWSSCYSLWGWTI